MRCLKCGGGGVGTGELKGGGGFQSGYGRLRRYVLACWEILWLKGNTMTHAGMWWLDKKMGWLKGGYDGKTGKWWLKNPDSDLASP